MRIYPNDHKNQINALSFGSSKRTFVSCSNETSWKYFDIQKLNHDMRYSLDQYREHYVIDKHRIPESGYTIYFLIPKSDSMMFKNSFLIFIATIFLIATIFRSGFSHTIMKRIYKNMVSTLNIQYWNGINLVPKYHLHLVLIFFD